MQCTAGQPRKVEASPSSLAGVPACVHKVSQSLRQLLGGSEPVPIRRTQRVGKGGSGPQVMRRHFVGWRHPVGSASA